MNLKISILYLLLFGLGMLPAQSKLSLALSIKTHSMPYQRELGLRYAPSFNPEVGLVYSLHKWGQDFGLSVRRYWWVGFMADNVWQPAWNGFNIRGMIQRNFVGCYYDFKHLKAKPNKFVRFGLAYVWTRDDLYWAKVREFTQKDPKYYTLNGLSISASYPLNKYLLAELEYIHNYNNIFSRKQPLYQLSAAATFLISPKKAR